MRNNYVAKYAREFNRSAKHADRKQLQKRGYIKHKKVFTNVI